MVPETNVVLAALSFLVIGIGIGLLINQMLLAKQTRTAKEAIKIADRAQKMYTQHLESLSTLSVGVGGMFLQIYKSDPEWWDKNGERIELLIRRFNPAMSSPWFDERKQKTVEFFNGLDMATKENLLNAKED